MRHYAKRHIAELPVDPEDAAFNWGSTSDRATALKNAVIENPAENVGKFGASKTCLTMLLKMIESLADDVERLERKIDHLRITSSSSSDTY